MRVHVVVVDDTGSVTGIAGNIVEKHLGHFQKQRMVKFLHQKQFTIKITYQKFLVTFTLVDLMQEQQQD